MFFESGEVEFMMNRAGAKRTPFLFGVDFEMEKGLFVENPLLQRDILFEVAGVGNISKDHLLKQNNKGFNRDKLNQKVKLNERDIEIIRDKNVSRNQLEIFPEDASVYNRRFNKVMERLRRGDAYIANLTIKTPIRSTLSMMDMLLLSSSAYKLYVPNLFVCFSPECFVKIKEGKISTFPMKGTIDANIPNAKEIILNDEKEIEEHNTIVELLSKEMASVADKVTIKRFRYVEKLKGSLLQVSSEIEGSLNENYINSIGTIIFKLLPAGSVSGAPKKAALSIISEAEQQRRGFYTGVAGYFDGSSLNSFVLIRFIEQENGELFFRSGGGITAKSNSSREYNEAIQKVYIPF